MILLNVIATIIPYIYKQILAIFFGNENKQDQKMV